MREPIDHRLSMLGFQNKFGAPTICYNSTNKTKCNLCDSNEKFKGFIYTLFDEENNINITKRKIKDKIVYDIGNNFSLFITKNNIYNTSYLIGLLSNTYCRWIGYQHNINNRKFYDSLFINYNDIEKNKKNLLINSKRILIEFDYILPMDKNIFTTKHFIWKYYAMEIQKKIFNIKNKTNIIKDFDWDNATKKSGNNKKWIKTSF